VIGSQECTALNTAQMLCELKTSRVVYSVNVSEHSRFVAATVFIAIQYSL